MRVNDCGVGPLHAVEGAGELRHTSRWQPIRPVDVKPDVMLGCDVGQLIDGIYGAGAGRPGDRDDRDRQDSLASVSAKPMVERCRINAARGVALDRCECTATEAEDSRGSMDRVMHFDAAVDPRT